MFENKSATELTGEDFFGAFNKQYHRVLVDRQGNPISLPRPGDTINGLQISCVLGHGAMGVVYEAVSPDVEIHRALKLALPESGRTDLERMRIEASVCSKLEHKNIVKVYSASYYKEILPYFVMELVEGFDLKNVIQENGKLPVEFVLAIVSVMTSALEYAHSQTVTIGETVFSKMVHRDIKPANILISKSGVVKLTDFGLAKFEKMTDASINGLILGTVPYMAPEHQKYNRVSVESDIFSIGVVLYEMLTGNRPYPEGTIFEIDKIIGLKEKADYEPVKSSVPDIPSDVEKIIARCLNPSPQKRYDSYTLLQYACESALENHTNVLPVDIVGLYLNNKAHFKALIKKNGKNKSGSKKKSLYAWSAGLVIMLVLSAAAFLFFGRGETSKEPVQKPGVDENPQRALQSGSAQEKRPEKLVTPSPAIQSFQPPTAKKEPSAKPIVEKRELATPRIESRIEQPATPYDLALRAFEHNRFESAADLLRKVDFGDLGSAQKDSAIVLLIESLLKSEQAREAVRIARQYDVNDAQYYLLYAQALQAMGMSSEIPSVFDKAISSASRINTEAKKNAYLLRARYFQGEYENLQIESTKARMLQAWTDFINTQCPAAALECNEAQVVLEKYRN